MLAVFEELYYADYQEGLEKSRADSAARSRDSYMKDPEKCCAWSHQRYMKDPEKSRADSAARSCESYKNDLEKSRDNSAARNREHRRINRGGWGGATAPQYFAMY